MERVPPGEFLRPLGAGELLDRAVSLCVRFCVPLALVDAGYAVTRGLYNYYTGANLATFWTDVAADIRAHAVIAKHSSGGTDAFALALAFVAEPVVRGALVAMASALYLGRPVSIRQAYRTAALRALPLLGITAIFSSAIFASIVLCGLFVAFGVVFASGFTVAPGSWRSFAIAACVLTGVVSAVAASALAAVVSLAWTIASITCVLERTGPVRSITSSARRLLTKPHLRRTLICAVASFALSLTCFVVASAGTVALPFLHGVARDVFQTVVGVIADMVTVAFGCVLYYDLRVREEGYDLEFAAREMQRASDAAVY